MFVSKALRIRFVPIEKYKAGALERTLAQTPIYTVTPIYVIRISYRKAIKKKNQIQNLLFAVCQFAIFSHSHGLLLDVVLCEKS